MPNSSQVQGLLDQLSKEISGGHNGIEGFIDDLQMFVTKRDDVSPTGLEEKLNAANRGDQIQSAQERKELFSKMLMKFQHYPSAQKLFAFFLARINDVFENHIEPHAPYLKRQEVDEIIDEKIINPSIQEMGVGFEHFVINHAHVRGMIYWLADRCHVRWC